MRPHITLLVWSRDDRNADENGEKLDRSLQLMKSHWLFGAVPGVLCVSWLRSARPVHVNKQKVCAKWNDYIEAIFHIDRALAARLRCRRRESIVHSTSRQAQHQLVVVSSNVWLNALHVSHTDKTAKVFLFIIRFLCARFFVVLFQSTPAALSLSFSLNYCVIFIVSVSMWWFTASSGFNE